jgi:glycosyltransferase involved in cell wall biosynthesis
VKLLEKERFMGSYKVLLTTSDYLPQLGGLTSFTLNIEACLKNLGIDYELLHWRAEDKKQVDVSSFDIVLNIHYLGGYLNSQIKNHPKVVNFIHGSEILFYSPNIVKRIIKRLLKSRQIDYFEKSFKNIFISDFTKEKLKSFGLKENFQRDLVFHNCIQVSSAKFHDNDLEKEELSVACIARDVPHKNLNGVLEFCRHLRKITNKKIVVYLTSDKSCLDEGLEIKNVSNISNEKRDEILASVNFNMLLSLDHSHRGFYEGFGLSILEGNIFGTPGVVLNSGGLPENVHHLKNGYVFKEITYSSVESFWNEIKDNYQEIKKHAFEHVTKHHGLDQYRHLLLSLCEQAKEGQ